MALKIDPDRVVQGWGAGPGAPELGLISTVATDSSATVYVLCRSPHPAMHVFSAEGQFLRTWSEHTFSQPHGLWIGTDDLIYTTDLGDHTVRIFSNSGELLQTIGTHGQIGEPGSPFNAPTRAVGGPSGDIFVSDGYGQNRIHRFSAVGRLLHSWGEAGSGPGQFDTPHSLWVGSNEHIYVIDRGNGRVQVFNSDGSFVMEWGNLSFPHDIFLTNDGHVLVTDCATRAPDSAEPYHRQMPRHPIQIFSLDGRLVDEVGEAGPRLGQFLDCPHSLWVDRSGDIYVSEVVTPNRLQKFSRS